VEPAGELPAFLLQLLRDAGLPVAIVAAVGTVIALLQFGKVLSDNNFKAEQGVVRTFAGSSRRVRAYALFVISHSVAVASTLGVAISLTASPVVMDYLGVEQAAVIQRVQAAIAAYFLVVDWWSFKMGDTLPTVAATLVGWLGGLLVLAYGAAHALMAESWTPLIPWVVLAFVWFKGFGWASSTGSGLARALQNP
jgi:hypothetical protein